MKEGLQMEMFQSNEMQVYIKIFEDFPHAVILLDVTSEKVVYANHTACEFYKYTLAEFRNISNADLHALPTYKLKMNIKQVLDKEKTIFQSKHKDKDGNVLIVDVLASPILIEGMQFLISVVIEASKTEREKMMQTDVFFFSPDPIALLDKDGDIFAVNQSFTALFGYTMDELKTEWFDYFVDNNRVVLDPVFHYNALKEGKITNLETVRRSKSGRYIDVNMIVVPFVAGDEPLGAQIVYREITEMVENRKQLDLFKEILQKNTDGVMITDAKQDIIWVNEAFSEITGYTEKDAIGKSPELLHSNVQDEAFYKKMWNSLKKHGKWEGEIWNQKKNGTIYIQWLHIFAIHGENNIVLNYVGFLKDLSDMNSVNKKILMMLEKDPLTSVYNRAYFFDHLSEFLQDDVKEGYVVFMDLDGFKDVNDRFGHVVGDHILIEFSKRMLLTFKDDTIARYGGDEFLILIKNKTKEEVVQCLEAFMHLSQKKYRMDLGNLRVLPSIGVSRYPFDSSDIEELIEQADKAMYHAKNNFLDYTFYEDIDKEAM